MFRVALVVLALWADDPTLRAARERFAAGKRAFEAGEYEAAVREFKAAREIKPSPILEYNIGLAYERLGRLDLALQGYRSYVAGDPKAPNRAEVESKIRVLEERFAREGSYGGGALTKPDTAPPPPPGPSPSPPPTLMEPPPPPASQPTAPPLPPSPAPTAAPGPIPPVEGAGAPPSAEPPPPAAPKTREPYRLGVGFAVGSWYAGGLGRHARNDTLAVESPGGVFIVGARGPLPAENLELAGDAVFGGYNVGPDRGGFGFLTIRVKFGRTFRPVRFPWLEFALYGGIDFNSLSFNLEDAGMPPETKSVGFMQFGLNGGAVGRLAFRLGPLRPEFTLAFPAVHLLPALGSGGKQLTNPKTSNMEPAAHVLDLDHGSIGASLEAGLGLRF